MKNILLIDDCLSTRMLTAFLLKSSGYKVTEVESALTALTYLEGEEVPADLIITDMNMPGMSGAQFISTLRTSGRYRYTPVIGLSSKSHEKEFKAAGATLFVEKTTLSESFARIVQRLLR